jgi:hypothetical protein
MFGMNAFSVYLPGLRSGWNASDIDRSWGCGSANVHYCIPIYWKPVPGLKLELLNADGSSMFRQPRRYSMKIREHNPPNQALHRQKKEAIFLHYHSGIHVRYYVCVCSIRKTPLLISFPLDAQGFTRSTLLYSWLL